MSSEPSSSATAGQQEPHQANENRDPEDDDLTEVPLHIQSVREGLLGFEHFLGLQAAMLLAGESDQDDIPLSAYKPDANTDSQRARERELVENAQALVRSVENAAEGHEWKILIRNWLRERVDSAQDGDSMSQKSFACTAWRLWKVLKTSVEENFRISPDLYLGFPMHDFITPKVFARDPYFSNYNLENLEKLSKHGLQCVPLEDYSFEAPTPCFPWAVFYICGATTGGKSTSEDSFYKSIVGRAADAASTALSMFEGLARFAEEKHDGRHIPPVIAVTFAGAKTTVWLAYCEILDERLRDHKIIRIWEGNLTKIWDAIQFCRIIDNLLFWAQHCLKPMVTKYLDQWRVRSFPSTLNVQSQLKKDTKTAELIDRIQDRLSSFGISTNEDLPSLIQQAIIFQEVTRPNEGEAAEANIASTLEENSRYSENVLVPLSDRLGTLGIAVAAGLTDSHEGKDPGMPSAEDHIPQPDNNSDHEAELLSKAPTQVEQNLAGSDVDNNNRAEKDVQQHQSVAGDDEGTPADPCELRSPTSVPLILENETTINILSNKRKYEDPQNPNIQEDTGEDAGENTKDASLAATKDKPKSEAKLPIISATGTESQTRSSPAIINQGKSSDSIEIMPPTPEAAKIVWEPDPVRPRANYLQLALRNMASRIRNGHVISLERQRNRRIDDIPKEREKASRNRKLFSEEPVTRNKPSVAPNPFVSDFFRLSFTVRSWLGSQRKEHTAGPNSYRSHRHGPYPTLFIWTALEDDTYLRLQDYKQHLWKVIQQMNEQELEQKLKRLGVQPGFTQSYPPPILDIWLRWRDKHIYVRLPAYDSTRAST